MGLLAPRVCFLVVYMDTLLDHLQFLRADSDRTLALVGSYNLFLVALSVLVASMAAYGALRIVGRINAAQTPTAKGLWVTTGAFTMGIGVWAMHFVGMLAFVLPVRVSYSIVVTLVSMLPSIFASGVALRVISREQIPIWRLLVGGTLMGAGIGVMHYTGMAAMQVDALMLYDPWLFAVSVIVAVVLASIAIYTKFWADRHWRSLAHWTQIGAALIMGFAVAGMHYTGMAAAYFFPGHGSHGIGAAIDPIWLSTWVVLITVMITGITLFVSMLDQRLETSRKHSEKLETLVAGRTRELQAANAQLQVELEQRRQAQEALIAAEDRLQQLLQRSAAILYIIKVDEGYPLTFVSSSVESVLGYTVEELYKPNFYWSRIHPADAALIAARITQVIEEGRMSIEYRLQVCNGDYRWFHDEMVAIYDDAKQAVEIVGSAVDITPRKQMEEELAAARDQALEGSRLKSEFLATVSHEIRTPLNGITGMAHLLLNTSMTAEQADYLETICYSADSLLTVINDVLDLSMVEAGKLSLVQNAFNPAQVVHDAVRLLALRAQEQNLTLHVDLAPNLPEFVRGDASRLRQVLLNLVGNAVKFTETGGVAVRMELLPVHNAPNPENSNHNAFIARFNVTDTGIGIDEAALNRLFQPFSQVDSSLARKHGGAGLGLVICKRLVELMGGEIGVESTPGRGSNFWFTVPLETVEDREVDDDSVAEASEAWSSPLAALATPQIAVDIAPAGAEPVLSNGNISTNGLQNDGQANLQGWRENGLSGVGAHYDNGQVAPVVPEILLVEDNLVNQKVALAQLARFGFTVNAVNNGREAVAAVQEHSYALILMDCQTPEMDGFEATRAIRAMEAQTQGHVPIIAMTANAMRGDREACLAAGMDDYLSKPFRPEQLRDIVNSWLK